MASVIVFGPTGQVGSAVALTAAKHGAKVWLAMRDTNKPIPGLTSSQEGTGSFTKVKADLSDPESVRNAVKTSGATRAFIYPAHGTSDHMRSTIEALKDAGITFVVVLSSYTVPMDRALRDIPPSMFIPYVHAQIEANLDDVFGDHNYVALRAGGFVTNILAERDGIIAGKVSLFGPSFVHDGIVPSDIGGVGGVVLAEGPKNGQKKIYVYGPEVLSLRDTVKRIGKVLGKEIEIDSLAPEEGYKRSLARGTPPPVAKYIFETLKEHEENGEKDWKDRIVNYEEGSRNVELYTGKPATTVEEWAKENKALFEA